MPVKAGGRASPAVQGSWCGFRRLAAAVHRNKVLSREGVLERIFTLAFRGLVYPQIWEDPAIDLEALEIRPTDHVLAIGSGGCNILNYLTADPGRISAIDLNGAHIALLKLKLCALRHLPDYEAFFRFFGAADQSANLTAYEQHIRPHLVGDVRGSSITPILRV